MFRSICEYLRLDRVTVFDFIPRLGTTAACVMFFDVAFIHSDKPARGVQAIILVTGNAVYTLARARRCWLRNRKELVRAKLEGRQ